MLPSSKVSLRCSGISIIVNVGVVGHVLILVNTPDSERCRYGPDGGIRNRMAGDVGGNI